ncbi:MAG: PAS domain-containing protein [Proteobacteria bacterium]|nr:PAS domain-containing protein [Pseudomonadota bacterium]
MAKQKHPERDFESFFPIGEALSLLLHPFAEVVLHDTRSGTVVRIWNAFTSRSAGDPSHLEGAPDLFTAESILGPYEKSLGALGRTKSMTAAIRDDGGTIIGFFCINLNVSALDNVVDGIRNFVAFATERPEPIYRNDLQEHVNYLVRDYLISVNRTAESLSRQERQECVSQLERTGLFAARNSVKLVAKALGVSRASMYTILGRVRDERDREAEVLDAASAFPTR